MPAAEEVSALSSTAKNLESTDLDELVARRGRMTREVDSLVAEVESLRSELEDYRSKSDLAKADLDAQLRVLQAKLKTEEAASALRRATIEQAAEEVLTRQALAEKTIAMLREQKEQVEKRILEGREKRRQLDDEAVETVRKIDASAQELATLQRELTDARDRASSFNNEHADLLATIARETEKLTQIRSDRDAMVSEIEKGRREIAGFKSEIESLQADSAKMRQETEENRRRTQEEGARLIALTKEVDGIDAKHAARVRELEKEISDKRETFATEIADRAKEIIARADGTATKITDDAKSAAAELKTQAESEAARLRMEGEEQARELVVNASREAEALRGRAQGDYDAVLSGALKVKAEASALRQDALVAAEALRTKTDSEVTAILKDAEASAGRIKKDAADKAQATVADAKAKADGIRSEAEQEARKTQQAAEAEYQRRVDRGKQEVADQLTQHQTKLSALKRHAEKQAAEFIETAKKSAREVNEEVAQIKAKADREAEAMVQGAKSDAEKILAKAERLATVSRERSDTEIAQRKSDCDKEITQRRRDVESEVAATRTRASDEIKAWREEQEAILQGRRDTDIDRTALKVQRVIEMRMEKVLTAAHVMDVARGLAPEVATIVRQVMSSDAVIEQEQLQRILGGKPAVANPFRDFVMRFGVKIGIAAGGILAAALLFWIFSAHSERSRTQQSRTAAFVDNVRTERKVARQWNPPQTSEWKATWTDNVIYTTGWFEREMDRNFQDKWIIALNRFVTRRLDLNDDVVVRIVPMEVNMIRRLGTMRNQITPATEKAGIANMRATEAEVVRRMEELLGGPRNLKAYTDFKRQFHAEYRPD